jgi:3-hydroxyacyl-CoA dehydrogenase
MSDARKVALIGAGLIGRAWAIAFARAGWSVALFDPDADAAERAVGTIVDLLDDLATHDLLDGQKPGAVVARIAIASSRAEALDGAIWMQENAPEDLEIKRGLWQELDADAPADAILASSTSALVPSLFTEGLAGRGRCLVAHPLNPPYLIPAVELVPAPWTEPATMERAAELMRSIGQSPIVMRRELDGFVMNRLQGALLEEAFRLVADGHCTVEEVDVGLREGLALRWSFMGPFETIDLNAPGGVRDYVARYGPIYERVAASLGARPDWTGPLLDRIEEERRAQLPASALEERQRWRDRRLMALAAHKRKAAQAD